MKSLQESLFDKDLTNKEIVLNVDAAYEYLSSTLAKSDFDSYISYRTPYRSYNIDKYNTSFYIKLNGKISYSHTDKSHKRGLDRIFDYYIKLHFDTYEEGCILNSVVVEFSSYTELQNEVFDLTPKTGSKRYVILTTDNIDKLFNEYVKIFKKIESYFNSNKFRDIVKSGKLDKPEWRLSDTLYNRQLKKYKDTKNQVIKDLKNYIKY